MKKPPYNDFETDSSEEVTKSQLKSNMQSLQKLGEALVKLSQSDLEKAPLPDNLRDAILHARTLAANESKRRQLQYIGKLMRHVDAKPIEDYLTTLKFSHLQETKVFHKIEKWRDQFISKGDEALQEFLELHPEADRQHLRTLIRNAKSDHIHQKKTGSETELFRYLRVLLKS